MSPLILSNLPSSLLFPASPAAGEEGCLERLILWGGTAADETWRQMPSVSVIAGDAIVDYRPCTVDIVTSPKFTEYYAFVQCLIPIKTGLHSARRPNLYQDARQYSQSPNIVSTYLAP
jgi:hypothetical protein